MPSRSEPYEDLGHIAYARELTAWREAAGLTKKQLADALGYTDQLIGQYERRTNTPSKRVSEDLDTFFKTNGVFVRHWKLIHELPNAMPVFPGFERYMEREKETTHLKAYSAYVVSGLLQIEDYARAIFEIGNPPDLEERLAQRMGRQALLTKEGAPNLFFCMDESVLRRIVSSRDVQRRQLQALLDVSERPNVTVTVVPWGQGYNRGTSGSLIVLGFKDGSHAAYIEVASLWRMFVEQPEMVGPYIVQYDTIAAYAHHVDESRSLIKRVMEEL
ncbi:helix-turn-helix transcriptional regulator [Actinomadura kijaniata]|uniref:Transcriptional regulator with XRE-family HTH domain n=1 Tax=Actinomadura namibiensis TaxID=182080 RepID=A0A7W3LNX0_ACTNM|nr:helix-turn-helix transcriptional regulator [Actinomadura namibiensis]MBA8951579.1 transcriptional regulator with XRE-family HTH domain [Actinomadura namibiensis]